MGTVVRSIMPAAVARKAGKRSVSKAKKVKNVGLKRTKGDVKKSHAPSKPVSRSASYKRRGVWAVKKKNGGKLPVHKIDDAYFAKAKTTVAKSADGFFKTAGAKEELSAARKADQKAVDTALLATIKKTEFLKVYLNAKFSLSKGDAPHEMKF